MLQAHPLVAGDELTPDHYLIPRRYVQRRVTEADGEAWLVVVLTEPGQSVAAAAPDLLDDGAVDE